MSKQRTGNFIAGGNPQVPSLTLNNGIFDSNEVYTAVNNNAWQPSGSGTYEIARSLRFRSNSSTYLERTPTVSSSRTTFTISLWTKFCAGNSQIFGVTSGVGTGSTQEDNRLAFQHSGDGQIQFYEFAGGSFTARKYTAARFRDPSAWYHIVARINYTEPSATNRIRIFVNGVEITAFSDITDPSLNLTSYMNGAGNRHTIGAQIKQFNNFYDGYLTEINVIDGQALDPSYFGYFDNLGIWQPKRYTGTYGANGFYLPFSENQTATNLGKNFAGSNLFTYSEQFDNGVWSKTNVTVSANSTAAPDGNTTADKIISTVTNGDHAILFGPGALTASARYTFSVYAKAAEYTNIFLYPTSYNDYFASFNLSTGIASTADPTGEVNMTAVGNGWYRCSWTFTVSNGVSNALAVYINSLSPYVGNASNGLFLWGAQLNLGRLDPYIQTVASAANTNWTLNNFTISPTSLNHDSVVDSPTNVFTTATDTGGVVSGNYCTLNVIARDTNLSLSNANLRVSGAAGGTHRNIFGTMAIPPSDVCYFEVGVVSGSSAGNYFNVGVAPSTLGLNSVPGGSSNTGFSIESDQNNQAIARLSSTATTYGAGTWFNTGDYVQVAIDRVNNRIWFGKNNTWFGSGNPSTGANPASSSLPSTGDLIPIIGIYSSGPVLEVNFGQRPFAYAPPTGFGGLNTTNLQALGATVTARAGLEPSKWFDVVLSAGNTTGRTVSGLKFQPDLVVFKNRDGTGNRRWSWFDSVRGPNNHLTSQLSDAEVTGRSDLLTSFNSDGFNVGADAAYYGTNGFNERWSHWAWKAGNDTVTNTSGSVSTQVRTSATSGFSIATYTPPSSGSFTFGHGLPSAPQFIILKERTSNGNWIVWHPIFGSPTNQGFYLNSSISPFAAGANWLTGVTSTTVGITQGQVTSGANPHIVYSFIEIPGFSKIGSFVGNGSTDGPFVYCGFRPRFIMARAFTNGAFWVIHDTQRDLTNPSTRHLYPHTSNAEEQLYSTFDILSNGFKCRNAADNVNYSGTNAIFIAFAESPFALNNRAR